MHRFLQHSWLLVILVACGPTVDPKFFAAKRGEPEKRGELDGNHSPASPSQSIITPFSLAQNGFHKTLSTLEVNPMLVPAQGRDQLALYDEKASEGLLKFAIQYNHPERSGSTTTFICRKSYLFTKANQRSLDYPFDNDEAGIYLKTEEGSIIQVGKYLPAIDLGPTDFQSHADHLSFNRWIHPLLCEGEFASVCRLEVKTIFFSDARTIPQHEVSIALYLGETSQASFLAKTPQQGPYPSHQHFGCHY